MKRFETPWLVELAAGLETDRGAPFEERGASLRIRPVRVTQVASVGEGLSLDLDPHDRGEWEHWGDFEATLEVRRRRRLGGGWVELRTRDDVLAWTHRQLDASLAAVV